MDEWRRQLREVVANWRLDPEHEAAIVDEMEQHLELELAELSPRIGETEALARVMAQVTDPRLRSATVRSPRLPAPSVQVSRTRATGMAGMMRDLKYGWRSLCTSPGNTAMATIALALGIGLTTLMFTVIYSLVLRGLPYEHADRITMVMEANPLRGEDELALSMHDFTAYRDAQRSFDTFGAWSAGTMNIAGDDHPERVDGVSLTAAALSIPQVRPLLGRALDAGDEKPDGALVVVLSHSLWRDRYAGDSAIVGRSVRIDGRPATVVGVMPEGFAFPRESKLWLPLRMNAAATPWGAGLHVNGVGRLRAGVSAAAASADFAAIATRLAAAHPETNEGVRPVIQPFIRATIPLRVYALLYAMFGAVGLVFLVACTNVANLLLARATQRNREVAIRVALGASRSAIARQFLVEALLLAMTSAALGALVAQGGLAVFRRAIAGQAPFWADFQLHPQVFVFIAGIAVVACVASGLMPAITASRSDITDVLKDQSLGSSSRKGRRLGQALVMFELILSSALLVVAALTTKSVLNLRSIQPGLRTAGVMTGRVTLSMRDSARRAAFFDRLESELSRLPGVTAASLSTNLPGPGWGGVNIAIEGREYSGPRPYPAVRRLAVTPGFFNTFDVTALRGRVIGAQDRAGTPPVAVVNQQFVERFFSNADPIGRRINLTPSDSTATWATIVGIVPNLYATDQGSINRHTPWPAEVITAFRQSPSGTATIAVRTGGDAVSLAQPLRALVASMDPDLPVYSVTPMTEVLDQSRWDVRIFGGLFVVFGVVALTLASIGLYAVLAFSVSRREREMGIRMALGARAANVVRLVVRGAVIQLAVAVPIGVLLGVSVARLANAVLFEVQPGDPMVLAVVIGTVAATGLAASIVPAMRATRADPVRSLQVE